MKRSLRRRQRARALCLAGIVINLFLIAGWPLGHAYAQDDVAGTATAVLVSPLATPTPAGGPPAAAFPRPSPSATPGPTATASSTPTATPTGTATPTATYAPFQVSPLVTLTESVATRGDLTQLWVGAAALLLVLGSALMVWSERYR